MFTQTCTNFTKIKIVIKSVYIHYYPGQSLIKFKQNSFSHSYLKGYLIDKILMDLRHLNM